MVNNLWTDGLLCAFEFVHGRKRKSRYRLSYRNTSEQGELDQYSKKEGFNDTNNLLASNINEASLQQEQNPLISEEISCQESGLLYVDELTPQDDMNINRESSIATTDHISDKSQESHWVPIGWARLSELVQLVQIDAEWTSYNMEYYDQEDSLTVADVAAPYWQKPAGPTWWCHVAANHPFIDSWLKGAHWLHPAISTALRDESRLISDRMKHLYYEVPVRVAGGLLFELLGQSVGDPQRGEDDVPIVLRSWQAQNFLVSSLHVKGVVSNLNVLGIIEIQDLLIAGGAEAPRTAHELIANLVCRLARWDDRLFRKYIFGAADEVELKFVSRRNNEDLTLLSIILNQEIKRLSTQAIRVKWSLHAREEIIFELSEHLRGKITQEILKNVRVSTREMIGEQEAVRDRLFTVQDVMQSTVRAWLQDRSIRITHNLAVFGGAGLVLSIIAGLFGINVDGIPGNQNTPYAFGLFTAILVVLGVVLVSLGMLYLGLKRPITEERVAVRKMELHDLVKTFQHDAETHANVRKVGSGSSLQNGQNDPSLENCDYILIT